MGPFPVCLIQTESFYLLQHIYFTTVVINCQVYFYRRAEPFNSPFHDQIFTPRAR